MSEVSSYLFVIDFLKLHLTANEPDTLYNSLIYFYPNKNDEKREVGKQFRFFPIRKIFSSLFDKET